MAIKTPDLIGMQSESLRDAFGKALVKLAPKYEFVVFDGDLAGGTGTHHFRDAYPDRFFQFGIAEQNMTASAAGFSAIGIPVFVTTFAIFAMRAWEMARLQIAYSNRNVKIVASHPGLDVGPDGASAQCLEDLACFRAIPGMVVISPSDLLEMEKATEAVLRYEGPVYMRTGRSPVSEVDPDIYDFEIGKGCVIRDGIDVTIVACGIETHRAIEARKLLWRRQGVDARIVNMSTIKPIDQELLILCAQETGCFVTCEDHNVHGGLGSAVAEVLALTIPCPIRFIGTRDTFGESGESEELSEKYGLTAPHIAEAAGRVIARKAMARE